MKRFWLYPALTALFMYFDMGGPTKEHLFLLVFWAGATLLSAAAMEGCFWCGRWAVRWGGKG